MVADTIAKTPTAGSTLARGQKIWIKPEPDRAGIVGLTPNMWVKTEVVGFYHGCYVVEGTGLPTKSVIRYLLQEIGGSWRFWVEKQAVNSTSLTLVKDSDGKMVAARQPPPRSGYNPLFNGHW